MEEIFIDINDYNKSFITATENDNNSDIYKIIVTEDGRRFDLTGKSVQMGYSLNFTSIGDIINLNITNPTEGEITLEITNELTKKDGDYTCQLLILGENDYRRHSRYYFTLSIRENLFNKISGEIIESPNLGILQELIKKAEFLNTQLENNNNLAETLNINLSENITIATPLNTSLDEKIPEATVKKEELESSIEKAQDFIDGLDGSQDIPGIRMELTELQNGLKSNQALAYSGNSIVANNTLEGRTEGMKIKGRTLQNIMITPIKNKTFTANSTSINFSYKTLKDKNKKYTLIAYVSKNTLNNNFSFIGWQRCNPNDAQIIKPGTTGLIKKVFTTNDSELDFCLEVWAENTSGEITIDYIMILEGEVPFIPSYFEGIKSFGEAEQEGDKYKISILSHSKNFVDFNAQIQDRNATTHKILPNGIQVTSPSDNRQYWCHSALRVKLKKNTNYYCSFKYKTQAPGIGWIAIRTINDTLIKDLILNNGSFNSGDNDEIDVQFYASLGSPVVNNSVIYYDFQIEEGTIQTPYGPYKCDKKDVLISTPLRGFDFGEDIMFEEEGKVKITRNVDTYTFTGDETMRDTTDQDEKSGTGKYKVFALTVNKTIDINKNINNNFPKKSFSVAFQNMDSEGLAVTKYGIYIKILKSKLSTQDTEGFKAWLKANTTTIYYALAAPITEIVENYIDIDLDTFQDKTYFSILNKIPGTLDFKVPSNLGSVVQSMAKEVNNIWDVINNLLVPGLMDTKKTLALKTIKNNLK